MDNNKSSPWGRLIVKQATPRRNYTLNTMAGVMSALTMLVLQLLTTRVLGAEAAGRVSVDAATVLLCFQIGQLNMRPYQCTDLRGRFSFPEYLTLKTITAGLMPLICLVYVVLRRYDTQRSLFCMAFCVFKALEAISDCFWAMMQQKSRIDLAGLGGALYHFTAVAAFFVVLFTTKDLGKAALIMALTGAANLLVYTLPLGRHFERATLCGHFRQIGRIVAILVPLFAAAYFLNVAITLPKYALERWGGDAAQGHFAALFMTAQGVLLLSAFLYFPQLTALARYFTEGDRMDFVRLFRKLSAAIIALDLFAAICGWFIGTQILGWLFDLTLTAYRVELVFILIGGGFFALYTLTSYALIAMRAQKGLALLTLAVLAASALLNMLLVSHLKLCGAALSFLLSMIIAALLVFIKLLHALRRTKEGEGGDVAA